MLGKSKYFIIVLNKTNVCSVIWVAVAERVRKSNHISSLWTTERVKNQLLLRIYERDRECVCVYVCVYTCTLIHLKLKSHNSINFKKISVTMIPGPIF